MASENIDFVKGMRDLLGMQDDAVEKLLDKLGPDEVQDLSDAIAHKDKDAASKVVNQFDTDEEVNMLFRDPSGDNNDDEEDGTGTDHKTAVPTDAKTQFGFGDDVRVKVTDEKGKRRYVTGTVEKPNGPESSDTVVVRIQGKSKVMDRKNVSRLKESMLGMANMPGLFRMQQLAGISGMPQPEMTAPQVEEETVEPQDDPVVDVEMVAQQQSSANDPSSQAMCALDALETALPCVTLSDLKTIRQRFSEIQLMMNESIGLRRAKKV